MTSIPGTDMTTEAARNLAGAVHGSTQQLPVHALYAATLLAQLADAYDNAAAGASVAVASATAVARRVTLQVALTTAKDVANRDKYSPQESAAAWDVVDALQTLTTASEKPEPADDDDHDGKQIARAAEWIGEGLDNERD